MITKTKLNRPENSKIITPVFRLSYPHIFTPGFNAIAMNGAGREQYDLTMLFDKKDKAALKPMYDLMALVAKTAFGDNIKGLRNPLKDGDTAVDSQGVLLKEKNEMNAGMMILSAWSKNKPGVVDKNNAIIIDHDEIYGGCYCKAQLNCYAYSTAGNRGVAFGLLHLQKIKDGEPFGNRTRAEDAFAPVADQGSLAEEDSDGGIFG